MYPALELVAYMRRREEAPQVEQDDNTMFV